MMFEGKAQILEMSIAEMRKSSSAQVKAS